MSDQHVHPLLASAPSEYAYLLAIPEVFWSAYFSALGRLMHSFAEAEAGLSSQLVETIMKHSKAKVTPPKVEAGEIVALGISAGYLLKSVMSGMRAAALKDAIKRTVRLTNGSDELVTEVNTILQQFSEIQSLRDRLAHNAAMPDTTNKEGWLIVANFANAKEPDSEETLAFKPEMLEAAASDLRRIITRLSFALNPDVRDLVLAQSEFARETYYAPWAYKSNDLKRGGNKHNREAPA